MPYSHCKRSLKMRPGILPALRSLLSLPAFMSTYANRPVSIREITEADIPAIRRIYAHHVEHGIATFEMTPPSEEEMLLRYRRIRAEDMPYLAAFDGDRLLGYCYASTYRPRPAYRFTVEDSIYLSPDQQGQGVGRQ